MPCRKENYIFLEQSVTVDSKEVDALVTKIGEALQLHNNSGCGGGGGGQMKSMSVSCLSGLASSGCCGGTGLKPTANIVAPAFRRSSSGGAGGSGSCCMRLRSRGQRGSSRASPYSIPGSNGEQDWDQIKPWSKKRVGVVDEDDDDPHRLLQELILSGNLIKEAVRRLQFSAAAADNVSCWWRVQDAPWTRDVFPVPSPQWHYTPGDWLRLNEFTIMVATFFSTKFRTFCNVFCFVFLR